MVNLHPDNPHNITKPKGGEQRAAVLRAKAKRKRVIWATAVVLVAVAVFCVITGINYSVKGIQSYRLLTGAQDQIDGAQDRIQEQDLEGAIVLLAGARDNVRVARDNLQSLRFMRYVPVIGRQYKAALHLVNAVYQINATIYDSAEAASEIASVLDVQKVENFSDLTPEQKQKVLQKVHAVAPQLDGALAELELAKIELEKIPSSGVLRQIKSVSNEASRAVPQLEGLLESGVVLSKVGPDLVGYPKEKRYLVLFLNNTELRPGGGFIGSYGLLKIKDGEIVDFPVSDVYDLDDSFSGRVEPPEPIKKYLAANWFMRDSNWSPDFPTSAEKTLEFYRLESGDNAPIDGVLAFTPELIQQSLGIIGGVSVPGYPYTFTDENFTETLERAVEYDFLEQGIDRDNRKQILGDLNEVLLERLLALPREQWKEVLRIALEDIKSRKLMIHLTDSIADRDVIVPVIQEYNWDGHLERYTSDYFMLVDANFYGLKSDPFIRRTVDYQVYVTDEGEARAKAIITYEHTGFRTLLTDRYQTYSRIFAPQGSELISFSNVDAGVDVVDEDGRTSFGFLRQVEPQTTQVVVVEYKLPAQTVESIKNNAYNLVAQKQLGSGDVAFNFSFQSPRRIKQTLPKEIRPERISNNQVTLSALLTQDRFFSLTFE